jgi:signal transduction histidine kinase
MVQRLDHVEPARGEQVLVGDILGLRERLDFEHLLQWLRLSFLFVSILVLLAFGLPALPYAVWIAGAVVVSYAWVGLLARFRPQLLLRGQLWLRVLDCALVFVVLINYHAFLHNAYYDTVYVLFVVGAAATHGRHGALMLSALAGSAVLIGRLQLIATGAMPFESRHLTDAVFYTLFFLVTSTAVAFLMHKTAEVVVRRERALSAEIAARNIALERTAGELAESMRLRDAMLAGVTHDLRTPLTVVKVQAQLLRRRIDERHWTNLQQIERAATRMARWIDELLEAATVHRAEDLDLTLEETDLVDIARQAVEEHQSSASSKHRLRLESDVPEIVGQFDAPRLERVIDNVLGNAIKYSPEGGCVTLSVSAADGWATLVVRDQGMGIPPEDLPHVFEPFRRGGNVIGRVTGTGIGLASAHRIVQRHGGTLSVESEPGKGSAFTMRLPLVDDPRPS